MLIAKLATLFAFTLSLMGCPLGRTTWSHRITDGHGDSLYSKAWAKDGRARFECVESSTGKCWYTVFREDCDSDACVDEPLTHFALARGDEREFNGLRDFRFCVTRAAAPARPDCREP
ncbi:MAG: hypothetical protein ACTHOC_09545 [Luteimonas sp.]